MIELKREELLISQLADLLVNDKHIAVGAASPIPGAALLAKEEAKIQNNRLRVTIYIQINIIILLMVLENF